MNKKHLTIKRALIMSAPFLLIAVSVALFTWAGFMLFVEPNPVYELLTNAPEQLSAGVQKSYLELDEAAKRKLKENNAGMSISADFPPIALGEQWATITIEAAGVYDVPVYHGEFSDLLMSGVGHNFNSRFPGQRGRVVLSGHVGIPTIFQRLETMKAGDRVVLDTIYGEYVYEVTETVIFNDNDNSYVIPLKNEEADQLVCYTCYPYKTTKTRTQRFAIICKKISGDDWIVEKNGGE